MRLDLTTVAEVAKASAVQRLPVIGQPVAVPDPNVLDPHSGPESLRRAAFADAQGRRYTYLRLSVVDRCNLACVYCMPPGGQKGAAPRSALLTFEEIVRLVSIFSEGGIRRVRLTGGEPLVRKDVVRLVAMIRESTPIREVVMTTNGTRLRELARPLREAGLAGVNVSLDTLDAERFQRLTRGGDLSDVLAGVQAALDAGLSVKLNSVVMRGTNEDELAAIVAWAWERKIVPRFIEVMPIGRAGLPQQERFVSAAEMAGALEPFLAQAVSGGSDEGPARYRVAARDHRLRVGFITAVSEDFCGTCNRLRLTAQGEIRPCLASRHGLSLRDLMRARHSDEAIGRAIRWVLRSKRVGHGFGGRAGTVVGGHREVPMSHVGG